MSPLIEDFEAIRRRQEELRAEQDIALKGSALPSEEPKTENWANYMMGHDYDPA